MKKIISLILIFILMVSSATLIYAEETENGITFTADKTKVKVGDTIIVTLKTKEEIQAADFSIKYNKDTLKFKETSVQADHYKENEGTIKVSTYSTSGVDTFTFTFEVIKAENCTISTDIEALNINQNIGSELKFENQTIQITCEKDWTDFSDAKIDIVTDNDGVHIKVNGVDPDKGKEYEIYISNNKDDKPKDEDFKKMEGNPLTSPDITDIYEKNEDIYIWIREKDKDGETKTIIEAQEVKRKEQLPLGERIEAEFTEDYTKIDVKEPVDKNRKVYYKIGEVTDKSIIEAVKNGRTNGLNKLLEYAKADSKGQTGTVDMGKTNSILDKLQLKDKTYYYIYLKVDDENGKYAVIEDVSLFMTNFKTLPDGTVIKGFTDYKSNDFDWNLINNGSDNNNNNNNNNGNNGNNGSSNQSGKDNTVANKPLSQTGESTVIIGIISTIFIIGIISIIKYRRYRDIQ